jgi:hypothetical protein
MNAARRRLPRWWWLIGLAVAVAVVVILAPLASGDPDGLNRVAENLRFSEREEAAPFELLPGYEVPFLRGSGSTIVAGVIGVVVVFLTVVGIGRLLARRSRQER